MRIRLSRWHRRCSGHWCSTLALHDGGAQICLLERMHSEAGKGAGAKLAQKLWDAGINIEYTYASTPGSGPSTAIFKVPDADAAIAALKRR